MIMRAWSSAGSMVLQWYFEAISYSMQGGLEANEQDDLDRKIDQQP
jgi:hypothetical protein